MEQSPFEIRGVIEGFYGAFYTFPERNDLIRFLGENGYNLYIYGPKNDRQHRNRWWEPYPRAVMEQFAETTELAAEVGVRFCYAISPLNYDAPQDYSRLTGKLKQLFDCGVRDFSLFMDDLLCPVHHEPSCKICPWPAEPDITLCNQLYEWLVALDPACTLSMCPTDYYGPPPFKSYLHDLGAGLHPQIDIFYSGPDVCSSAVQTSDARSFADAARRPPLIWDNYPVNDLAMRPYMHIGPIRGRESTLHEAVRGIVINPMLQPEASKIPLLTWAEYFADPHAYDPWQAWQRALVKIGGEANYEALLRFAENSLYSCLSRAETPPLERLTDVAVQAINRGEQSPGGPPIKSLNDYLNVLDESCYILKNRMTNLALRHDLLPWVEALDEWVWVGKRAMRLVEAMDGGKQFDRAARGIERAVEEVQAHTKRTAGNALQSLARAVLSIAEQRLACETAKHDHVSDMRESDAYPSSLAA